MRPIVAIALLGFLAVMGVLAVWMSRGRRLERSQDEAIRAAARRYDVDPALVKAVVWRESRFNPAALGRAGEIGLMQLQEVAAQEWADAEGIAHFKHEDCLDPRTNTLAGTFYLSKLLQRYRHTDNPTAYALADYNAGRSNVLKWLTGAGATNSAVFIQQIGFPATRDYVRQVMKRSRRYHSDRALGAYRSRGNLRAGRAAWPHEEWYAKGSVHRVERWNAGRLFHTASSVCDLGGG